ncbi:hypothetical protein [Streptomyces sp. 5-10]|uniref:hypothetical protein n=1 Tax=Streptomyces sp. 5-10 TaxID=878925 RepID=UPI00168BE88B|nr:hypothetical protein [Streptomyces sp. 5-10]MBD3004616.1 hypothetical protein [Streptomyces sp. 5-10]
MDDIWMADGNPLKFQDGDRVKINRSPEYPGRIDGWVRGYELLQEDGTSLEPTYDIYLSGDPLLCGVRESVLELQPPHMQQDHEHSVNRSFCGICGWAPGRRK